MTFVNLPGLLKEQTGFFNCQKNFMGGVGGLASPLTEIVSTGSLRLIKRLEEAAGRAGRFRLLPKPYLTFFAAISFS